MPAVELRVRTATPQIHSQQLNITEEKHLQQDLFLSLKLHKLILNITDKFLLTLAAPFDKSTAVVNIFAARSFGLEASDRWILYLYENLDVIMWSDLTTGINNSYIKNSSLFACDFICCYRSFKTLKSYL